MDPTALSRRETLGLLAAGPAALAAVPASTAVAANSGAPAVLMPIGDATEAMDTLYPYFRVAEDGYRAVVAGPEARLYHLVLHEIPPAAKIPWDITEERPGYHLQAEVAFHDVDPAKYEGLFVSGGRAGVPAIQQGPDSDHPPLLRGGQAGCGSLPRHRNRERGRGHPRPHRDHPCQVRPSTPSREAPATSTAPAWSTATSSPHGAGKTTPRSCANL